MADVSNLTPGQTISFELETKVLANEFKTCSYLGQVSYELAVTFDDVDATHANIYSTLPTGTPNDPRQYNYILVKLPSGEKKPVGIPWIKDPVTVVETCIITAKIYDASVNDAEDIKRALNARGYSDITITVN